MKGSGVWGHARPPLRGLSGRRQVGHSSPRLVTATGAGGQGRGRGQTPGPGHSRARAPRGPVGGRVWARQVPLAPPQRPVERLTLFTGHRTGFSIPRGTRRTVVCAGHTEPVAARVGPGSLHPKAPPAPPRPFGRRRRGDRHRGPFPGPAARRPGSRCSAVRPPPPVTSLKNARRPGGQRGDDEAESAHGGRPRPRDARAPLPATLPRLRTAAGPGPSPGLRGSPRPPVHRPRPSAAASPPPRPSQPAPHWRAAVARVSTFRGDLHETLPYWLPPPHVTLAPYAHVENCCCRSDSAPLPAPPPERAVLQPAGAEVTGPGRGGPSGSRRRRGGAGSPDAAPPRQDAHPCPPPAGPPGRAGRCRATAQPFPAGTAADGAVKTTG